MQEFPINDIKRTNFARIFHLIYQNEIVEGKLAKQDIAYQLNLSLPTVTQNLKELLQRNLILEDGKFSSNGGRKAIAYSLNRLAKVTVGVEIFREYCTFVLVDLVGTVFARKEFDLSYENSSKYYQEIASNILSFIAEHQINPTTILGVGFGIQGLVSTNGNKIIYGKILNNTDLNIQEIAQHIDFPCRFVHDAQCVALTEQWVDSSLQDALILSIGEHLGGALLINEQLYNGENQRSGTIEHTVINPNGPKCYCGKKGCVEVYCSLNALTKANGMSIPTFFEKKQKKEPEILNLWQSYLDSLATAVDNFHMFLDNKIILSGEILNYFTSDDLTTLQALVKERSAFPETENFVLLGKFKEDAVAVGAALSYVHGFLDHL